MQFPVSAWVTALEMATTVGSLFANSAVYGSEDIQVFRAYCK